jgi:hypothetical protein
MSPGGSCFFLSEKGLCTGGCGGRARRPAERQIGPIGPSSHCCWLTLARLAAPIYPQQGRARRGGGARPPPAGPQEPVPPLLQRVSPIARFCAAPSFVRPGSSRVPVGRSQHFGSASAHPPSARWEPKPEKAGEEAMREENPTVITSGYQTTPAQLDVTAATNREDAATTAAAEGADAGGDGLKLEPLSQAGCCAVEAFARSRVRSVEIPDTCTSTRGKISYTLLCTSGSGSTWEVTKRFRELHALRESLVKKHAPISSIQFPGKSLFKGSDEATVQARKHGLWQWINSVICIGDEGCEAVEREVQMFLVQTEGRNGSWRTSAGQIDHNTTQSPSPGAGVVPEYSGHIFLEEKEPGSLFGGKFNCYLFQLQTGRAEADAPRCMLARPLEPGKPPIDVRGAEVTKRPRNKLQDFCIQIRDQKRRNFVLGWDTSDEEDAKHWEWLQWLRDAGATLSRELLDAMHEARREKEARQSHSQVDNCWVHAAIDRAKVGDWAGLLGCLLHRPALDNLICSRGRHSCEVTRMNKELLNCRPAFYNDKGGQRWSTILHQIVYPRRPTYQPAVCYPGHMAFRRLIAEGCEFDLNIESGEEPPSKDPRERKVTVLQLIDYHEEHSHYPGANPLDCELVQLVRKLANRGTLDDSDLDKPAFDCEVEWLQGAYTQHEKAHRGRLRLHVVYQSKWQLEFEGDESDAIHRHWDLPEGAVDCQICDDEQVLRVQLWDVMMAEPRLIWLQFAFAQGSSTYQTMEKLHLAFQWLKEHRKWALAVKKEMWTGVVSPQPLVWEACCSPEGGRTQDFREKIWRTIGGSLSIGTAQGKHSVGKISWMEPGVTAWSDPCTPFEVVKVLSSGEQHATSVVLTLSGVAFRHRVELPGTLKRLQSGAQKIFRSRQEVVTWIQRHLILDSDSLQRHLERSFEADAKIVQFERVKDDGTFSKYEINLHTMVQTNIDGTKAALWRWLKVDHRGHRTWEHYAPECAQRLEKAYNVESHEIIQVQVGDGRHCVNMANKQRMWQTVTGSSPEQVLAHVPVIRSEQIVAGSERMIRRTAAQTCPKRFPKEQIKHHLLNSTGFALHLVEYKLSEGRWYLPPPGRTDAGEEVRWSTCNEAEGFIVYDLYGHGTGSVATLTLILPRVKESADATDIDAKFSTASPPITAALFGVMSRTSGRCQREFCATCCSDCISVPLPQLEPPRDRIQLLWNYSECNREQCRWKLIETCCYTDSKSSRRNTVQTMCSVAKASGPVSSVGKGGNFVTCCWTAETEVKHELKTDYYEQKVPCKRNASILCTAQNMSMALGVHAKKLHAAVPPVQTANPTQTPILKEGDKVVVLEDEHCSDFVQVWCPSTRRRGYVPACLLADDRASHTWEVEIRSSRSDDLKIIPAVEVEGDEQVRGASLFDLDCDESPQSSIITAEVRKTPSGLCPWEGEWQLIVRGLRNETDYELRVRSTLLPGTSEECKTLSAQVQFKGKGDFVPMQVALDDTVLSLGTSRRACVVNCQIRSPKSKRYGHPCAFRVDLSQPDSHNDTKYIIDPGSETAREIWIRALEKNSRAPTAPSLYGEWSKTVATRTWRDAQQQRPLILPSFGQRFEIGGLCVRVGAKLGKPVEPSDSKRWVRIRPDTNCSDTGMDVVWNLQPKLDARVKLDASVLQTLTVKLLVEAIGQDTVAQPTLLRTVKGLSALCGRVKMDPRQMLRLEFQTGQKQPIEIDGSWLTSHNPDVVEQRNRLPTGRFLHVERCDGRPLEIAQICIKDSTGRLVTKVKAAMSSSDVFSGLSAAEESFPARYAVDSHLGTYCKTLGGGEQWLRIDMGQLVEIQEIELVFGFEIDGMDHDEGGVTVRVTSEASGNDCAWEGKPFVRRSSSDWISRYRFETVNLEPEPETAGISSADGSKLQRQLTSRSFSLIAKSLDVQPILEYDPKAFRALCHIKAQLLVCDQDVIKPTPWKDISDSQPSIPMPFDSSVQAVGFRVLKKYSSKAAPFLVQFKDAQDREVSTIMKEGDDLRFDQLVMQTLKFFNALWEINGVRHVTAAGVSLTVAAPTYLIAPCGHSAGFLEELPDTITVEKLKAEDSACDNEFPSHDNLLPSAVAAFISGFALKIKDRHKSNMLVLGDGRFANIDFGWLGEAATYNILGRRQAIDADTFPIPDGLKYRLKHDHLW